MWFALTAKSRFLFKKGMIDVIFYLDKFGKAGYYKIYKQKFVVGRQTFGNILKKLEKEGIVNRKVIESRPPRVEYSLTEKGKNVAKMLYELDKLLT